MILSTYSKINIDTVTCLVESHSYGSAYESQWRFTEPLLIGSSMKFNDETSPVSKLGKGPYDKSMAFKPQELIKMYLLQR